MSLSYPTDREENYKYRAQLLYQGRMDPSFRSAVKEWCREDILFWINCFCWTFDPRPENQKKLGADSANLLFITWPFQDEAIRWFMNRIDIGQNGVVEKSRDMGASWLVLCVLQWYWQFGPSGNDFKLGSRKEDYVDKIGDMDALFPKIRYQLNRQPVWLLPKGFDQGKHCSFMNIVNPETGSGISGESNNPYFGTGGRKKCVVFDEFAKWDHTGESAWQSASDVTDCKIAISSANGRGNHFYRLRAQQAGDIDVLRLHWTSHPLKTRAWYEKEKKERTKQDLAAEVDIDYTASVSNKAWESFEYDLHVLDDILYDPTLPIILACDFNIEPMSWILLHEIPPMSVIFDELVDPERTRTEYHIQDFVKKYANHENKVIHLYGDATGRHGHPSSKQNNYDIIKDTLMKNGWEVQDYVSSGNPPVVNRLAASNKRLKDWSREGESFVVIHPSCKYLIDSLEQSRRKGDGIDKKGNVEHAAEAWSYYEAARYPIRDLKLQSQKLKGF